jgi:hypothetical protein
MDVCSTEWCRASWWRRDLAIVLAVGITIFSAIRG